MAGDAFAGAYALIDLWLNLSVQRRHLDALESIDRALEILSSAAQHADLRDYALHARILNLQNLSRWPEAEATLHEVRRTGQASGGMPDVTAAVLMFWLGPACPPP